MQTALSCVGAFVAALCALLLLRTYWKTRTALLFWSGLCFVGLALGSALAVADLREGAEPTMYTLRLGVGAASLLCLVYGLIFRSE